MEKVIDFFIQRNCSAIVVPGGIGYTKSYPRKLDCEQFFDNISQQLYDQTGGFCYLEINPAPCRLPIQEGQVQGLPCCYVTLIYGREKASYIATNTTITRIQ